jgi:ketosteroid isomerase-like protein
MRYTTLLLIFTILSNIGFTQTSDDAAQIKHAHALLNEFVMKQEVREAAKLYAPEFTLITVPGKITNRDGVLRSIGAGEVILETNESENVEVDLKGVTALVTAVLHQKGFSGGKAFDTKVRMTETWIRTVSGWKILSQQPTSFLSNFNETYNE